MKSKLGIAVLLFVTGVLILSRRPEPQLPSPEPAPVPQLPAAQPKRSASLRLPTPKLSEHKDAKAAAETKARQLLTWLEKGSTNQLSTEVLSQYLAMNQRSVESLLAAFRTTGDKDLLKEALEKYPDDPRVNFTALFNSDTPEERQQRLEALKKADPDNAMANFLAAQEAFKAGNTDLAVQELMAASGKTGWQDYSREFTHSAEEAYRAAGYSEAEAKAMAATGLVLPQLQELRDLGRKVNDLAGLYQQAGDYDSALAARQIGLSLGERFTEPTADNSLLKQLVGIAIQNQILASMNPASPYDNTGRTVQQELEALKQQRDAIRELVQQSGSIFSTLNEQEIASYFDRQKTFGELATIQWLISRQKKP